MSQATEDNFDAWLTVLKRKTIDRQRVVLEYTTKVQEQLFSAARCDRVLRARASQVAGLFVKQYDFGKRVARVVNFGKTHKSASKKCIDQLYRIQALCDAVRRLYCTGDALRAVFMAYMDVQKAMACFGHESGTTEHPLQPHEAAVFARAAAECPALLQRMHVVLQRSITGSELYGLQLARCYVAQTEARPPIDLHQETSADARAERDRIFILTVNDACAVLRLIANDMRGGVAHLLASRPDVVPIMRKKVATSANWPLNFAGHLRNFVDAYRQRPVALNEIYSVTDKAEYCSAAGYGIDYLFDEFGTWSDELQHAEAEEDHVVDKQKALAKVAYAHDYDDFGDRIVEAHKQAIEEEVRLHMIVRAEARLAASALRLVGSVYAQHVAALLPTGLPNLALLCVLELSHPHLADGTLSLHARSVIETRTRRIWNARRATDGDLCSFQTGMKRYLASVPHSLKAPRIALGKRGRGND